MLRSPENESGTTEEFETDSEEMLYIPLDSEPGCLMNASQRILKGAVFQTDAAQSDSITDDMDLDWYFLEMLKNC